ncbi:hypothetical protein E2986_12359 [Frieseomelitta varia]|uniref:F5/8 type C domain-containing protein n=1 Tax=Frieseomelitta varia TaxID=561572 RepID=A0A833RM07_9HYME|nr:hypothetical protein E2986_12359 [Frieseomelitta varia]
MVQYGLVSSLALKLTLAALGSITWFSIILRYSTAIRQEKNGGAWCPKAQISSAIREYLEIDLTRNHLIAWTETQGRFGNGQGQEYAEAFFLEYWRDTKWHQYKNLMGDRVLRGNSNTYLVEKQKLDLPFVASKVRFVPYSQHPRTTSRQSCVYNV